MGVFCVANAFEDTISVLSQDTFEITETILLPPGSGPRRLCSDSGILFCANSFSDNVAVIGDTLKLIPVGKYPTGIACSKGFVYVTCGDSNDIWALDQKGKQHICAPAGGFPNSLVQCRNTLICASMLSNEVRFYDLSLQLKHTIEVGEHPVFAVYCSINRLLYVCHAGDSGKYGSLCIYTMDGRIVKKFFSESMVTTIALTPKEASAYICCTGNGAIWVLDCISLEITEKRNVGNMPDDMVIDRNTGYLIVSCMLEDCVKVFDSQGKPHSVIQTGREPRGLCYCESLSIR
ncbi:MAG: YncE family protein [Christensenellales bacterium]